MVTYCIEAQISVPHNIWRRSFGCPTSISEAPQSIQVYLRSYRHQGLQMPTHESTSVLDYTFWCPIYHPSPFPPKIFTLLSSQIFHVDSVLENAFKRHLYRLHPPLLTSSSFLGIACTPGHNICVRFTLQTVDTSFHRSYT